MTPTIRKQADWHWATLKFLQEVGPIYNEIPDFTLRDWAIRYCLWLRDRYVSNTPLPAPLTISPEALALEDRFNRIAKTHFGGM